MRNMILKFMIAALKNHSNIFGELLKKKYHKMHDKIKKGIVKAALIFWFVAAGSKTEF